MNTKEYLEHDIKLIIDEIYDLADAELVDYIHVHTMLGDTINDLYNDIEIDYSIVQKCIDKILKSRNYKRYIQAKERIIDNSKHIKLLLSGIEPIIHKYNRLHGHDSDE